MSMVCFFCPQSRIIWHHFGFCLIYPTSDICNCFYKQNNTSFFKKSYLDLSKVFDTLDHDINLHNLDCYELEDCLNHGSLVILKADHSKFVFMNLSLNSKPISFKINARATALFNLCQWPFSWLQIWVTYVHQWYDNNSARKRSHRSN